LLSYAFDVLQWERVEIKTDNLNERAKQGLRKIGAKEEGVLRSHMQMPLNRRRDSVYFSILKNEWPPVRSSIFKEITTFQYSDNENH
jgi:RimJ/RimL family protein N-acetyltransferase